MPCGVYSSSAHATVIQVMLCYLNMILKNFSIGKQGSYIFCEDTDIKTVSLFPGAISLPSTVNFTRVSPPWENGIEILNGLLIMACQIYLKTVLYPLVHFGWFFPFEKQEHIPTMSVKPKRASFLVKFWLGNVGRWFSCGAVLCWGRDTELGVWILL